MSERIAKVNKLIEKHLGELIERDVDFKPGVFVTIAKIDTSRDLRYTRVSISVLPETEKEYAMKTLEKELYDLQGKLNKKLHMKILPRIQFFYDDTEVRADVVERLLREG